MFVFLHLNDNGSSVYNFAKLSCLLLFIQNIYLMDGFVTDIFCEFCYLCYFTPFFL